MNEYRDAEIARRHKAGEPRVALAVAFGLKPERVQQIIVKDYYRQRRRDNCRAWSTFVEGNIK